VLVSKVELARILGISRVTLDEWIARDGNDFPVVERGRNGREWKFDSDLVVEFVKRRDQEREREAACRDEAINQLALPFGHNGGPPLGGEADQAPPLRPAELLMLAKLRKLQREEDYELGRLVRIADVSPLFKASVTAWRVRIRAAAERFGEQRNWPEAEIAALVKAIEDCQVAFVEDINRACAGKSPAQATLDLEQLGHAAE